MIKKNISDSNSDLKKTFQRKNIHQQWIDIDETSNVYNNCTTRQIVIMLWL